MKDQLATLLITFSDFDDPVKQTTLAHTFASSNPSHYPQHRRVVQSIDHSKNSHQQITTDDGLSAATTTPDQLTTKRVSRASYLPDGSSLGSDMWEKQYHHQQQQQKSTANASTNGRRFQQTQQFGGVKSPTSLSRQSDQYNGDNTTTTGSNSSSPAHHQQLSIQEVTLSYTKSQGISIGVSAVRRPQCSLPVDRWKHTSLPNTFQWTGTLWTRRVFPGIGLWTRHNTNHKNGTTIGQSASQHAASSQYSYSTPLNVQTYTSNSGAKDQQQQRQKSSPTSDLTPRHSPMRPKNREAACRPVTTANAPSRASSSLPSQRAPSHRPYMSEPPANTTVQASSSIQPSMPSPLGLTRHYHDDTDIRLYTRYDDPPRRPHSAEKKRPKVEPISKVTSPQIPRVEPIRRPISPQAVVTPPLFERREYSQIEQTISTSSTVPAPHKAPLAQFGSSKNFSEAQSKSLDGQTSIVKPRVDSSEVTLQNPISLAPAVVIDTKPDVSEPPQTTFSPPPPLKYFTKSDLEEHYQVEKPRAPVNTPATPVQATRFPEEVFRSKVDGLETDKRFRPLVQEAPTFSQSFDMDKKQLSEKLYEHLEPLLEQRKTSVGVVDWWGEQKKKSTGQLYVEKWIQKGVEISSMVEDLPSTDHEPIDYSGQVEQKASRVEEVEQMSDGIQEEGENVSEIVTSHEETVTRHEEDRPDSVELVDTGRRLLETLKRELQYEESIDFEVRRRQRVINEAPVGLEDVHEEHEEEVVPPVRDIPVAQEEEYHPPVTHLQEVLPPVPEHPESPAPQEEVAAPANEITEGLLDVHQIRSAKDAQQPQRDQEEDDESTMYEKVERPYMLLIHSSITIPTSTLV
uniref:Uncharacterized protein n=1 Tax=Ditylenchus dipsaci TaxID=166011 RepID=A0A915EP96_9BILA